VNLFVARRLLRAGREFESITLEADARHLFTDVWTSAGVILGVGLVALTGLNRLDAVVALLVAANIIWTGVGLMRRSALGLLDRAVPVSERATIQDILARLAESEPIKWHALWTRQAGRRRFVSLHVLVPGGWTVQRGHELLEAVEHNIRVALPHATVFTHIEPIEDPASYEDATLDRVARSEEAN